MDYRRAPGKETSDSVFVTINSSLGSTYEIKITNSLGQIINSIEKTFFSGSANVLLDVSDVNKQKSAALINHESQMMDWIPWTMNQEDMIPEDYDIQNRLEILEMMIIAVFSRLLTDYRKLWKKGYPDRKVTKAEAFEICEYGRQPSVQELKDLFPGAYIPRKKDLKELLK